MFIICRMFPETFEIIMQLIGPALSLANITGRKQISAEKQLLITLWFLATPDSYRYLLLFLYYNKIKII